MERHSSFGPDRADERDQKLSEVVDAATGGRREWNRREWAGEADGDREPPRWNRHEWAGEPPDPSDEEPGGMMPPGAGGPQGFGHNPGEQHWARSEDERPEAMRHAGRA